MSTSYSLAVNQVERIAQLCDFLEQPALLEVIKISIPVTMPADIGSLGFDTGLWVGFGLVGLWSALDAFAERSRIQNFRCAVCKRKGCLASRLTNTGKVDATAVVILRELEDLRHLFAHNFAGHADQAYFGMRRHAFQSSHPTTLSSGAAFDGSRVNLSAHHLHYYAKQSRAVLIRFA